MQRFISGALIGAAVLAAVWFLGTWPLLLVAVGVLILAFVEYARLAEARGVRVVRGPGLAASVLVCVAAALPSVPLSAALAASLVLVGGGAVLSGRPVENALAEVTAGLLPVVYLGFSIGCLVAVHALVGRAGVILLLGAVVASDTSQLYVGRALGRRLLAPIVSPKKTWEGALGGLVAATLTSAALGPWALPHLSPAWHTGLGLVVGVSGILGDLFESALKRSAGVKDASRLIPGHGGVLDRIDALLFAAPIYYVLLAAP